MADLPGSLKEVSGIETTSNSNLIWMINDGGNKPELFALNPRGKIKKVLWINTKNRDWEDLAADESGNLYIGDFGNNTNKRKNLAILKVPNASLKSNGPIGIERINFKYPNQKKFPPKKKQRHFDSEAFFYYNDSLYIFTKSRVQKNFGRTNLYKIPAKRGNHTAEYISSFETCKRLECWITAADISKSGKKVVLLNHKSAWVFTNFKGDDFFSGNAKEFPFYADLSQKEAVCFKNENTILITDEQAHGSGGNMYKFSLD